MAKDSYDRILEKLDSLNARLSDIEEHLGSLIDNAGKRLWKKAKDLPIGTKVRISEANLSIYEVIAYSKNCDEIVVLENDEGHIVTDNVNDIDVVSEV